MKPIFNHPKRVKNLRDIFAVNNIDSLFINIKERIYYLTGYMGDDSYLLVTDKEIFLFTDARYKEELKSRGYNFKVLISKDIIKDISSLFSKLGIKNVGIEESYISYSFFKALNKNTNKTKIIPSQRLLDGLMTIKDKDEVGAIRKAIEVSGKTFRFFKKIKKVGLTELDIAQKLDNYILKLGGERGGFETMVISGERSASAHAKSSSIKIKNNSNLIIDLGVKSYGYNSDLTRAYTLSKMKGRFKEIFDTVKTAQDKAIRAVRPGVRISEIDFIIRNYFKKLHLDKFFIHASGHGIGLFVHEKPIIGPKNNELLMPGMVFTLEPGIYLPGEFGIRLEDMILVTKNKYEVLSYDIPNSI